MNRKLSITFDTSGDVCYHFWRSVPINRYLVEHPASQVAIKDPTNGFDTTTDAQGFLELRWLVPITHTLSYVKRGKLESISSSPNRHFRYRESIHIKAESHFGIWLGSPQPLSALKAHSTAVFETAGVNRSFKPRELSEYVFHASGILHIDYCLEQL